MENASSGNVAFDFATSFTARTGRRCCSFPNHRVTETGIPDHVARMYLEQSADRLIKIALRSPQPAIQPITLTGLDETFASIARQTKYSTLMTPSQRKAEAVKRKLDN